MIAFEIVATCSNSHVARAAVASIGGDFACRFARDAADLNLSSGMLASRLVRDFARRADDGDWDGLDEAIRGADTPILAGLRHILERGLELGANRDDVSSAPAASRDRAWASCRTQHNLFAPCGEPGMSAA